MSEKPATGSETVRVVIALGSNIPDRQAHLQSALDLWKNSAGVDVVAWSRVYESPPEGDGLSGDFLNAVIVCDVSLTAEQLLEVCHSIEDRCGRDRGSEKTEDSHNRTLDCDVIFFGDIRVDEPWLIIPHPRWHERAFVLFPLLDVQSQLTEHQKRLVEQFAKVLNSDSASCGAIKNVLN